MAVNLWATPEAMSWSRGFTYDQYASMYWQHTLHRPLCAEAYERMREAFHLQMMHDMDTLRDLD